MDPELALSDWLDGLVRFLAAEDVAVLMPVNSLCREHADALWSALLLRDFSEPPSAGCTAASHYTCIRQWRAHAEKSIDSIRRLPAQDADAVLSYMARRDYYPLPEEETDSEEDELARLGYVYERETKTDQDVLHAACMDGLVQTMQVLVDKGVPLDSRPGLFRLSPLELACSQGQLEILKMILAAAPGTDVNASSALQDAASAGHLSIVRHLWKEVPGLQVDVRNRNQATPLHEACSHGQLEVVRYLAEDMGADVHALDAFEKSSLFKACYRGQPDVVKYLLTVEGIDLNRRDIHWITPYAIAQLYLESHPGTSYEEVVAILEAVPGIDLTPHPELARRRTTRAREGRGRGGYHGRGV
eukprot:TRINITY_DN101299_c0_g1_i1.p1 TRINITY_DN101299_c0_g1~~TRINITY_DN101299_c0_g1_i1.p1  ORF type:complete len:359 (-),score=27.53 TRINITY_DN101299_c0_g1_i1:376-1452(-)